MPTATRSLRPRSLDYIGMIASQHPADVVKDEVKSQYFEDVAIIRRVMGGEVNAFELLVARYGPFVNGVVGRHVPRDRVEEVSQDVFVSAYGTLGTYSGKGGFKSWLGRIAVRRCCDFWRERSRQQEMTFSEFTDEHDSWLERVVAEDSSKSFRDSSDRSEALEVLDYALGRLSPENRTALTLVYLDGKPIKEAADLLGWNSVLLRVRVHRAKAQLRKIIAQMLEMKEDHEKKT